MSSGQSMKAALASLWSLRYRDRRFIGNRMLFFMAYRNLVYRKLRTVLTLFGIVVGIGAIFFLLSFGLGLQELVTQQVVGDRSIKSIDVSSPNSRILQLTPEAVNKISNLPHVQQVSRTYSFPGIVEYQAGENDAVAYGVDTNYASLNSFSFVAGHNLDALSDNGAVVTRSVIQNWGVKASDAALGRTFILSIPADANSTAKKPISKEFKVVGVIDQSSGSEVFVSGDIFTAAGVAQYSQVKIVTDETSNVAGLRKQIEAMGYVTAAPIDTLDQINQVFRFFTIILAGFGAIGMIVAVLGMFNTLTISLLERTKEIGLMFALGARQRDMYRLFVFEAVLLSLLGAAFGMVSATVLGLIANFVMNSLARGRGVTQSFELFSYPWWLVVGTLLFMLLVGFVVVLFPARRAKGINPIDALRRE